MRTTLIATLLISLLPAGLSAQPSAPVVTKTDVIYGRVEGSARSDLAFASRAQDECRHEHRRNGQCNERDAADREAVEHSEE